MKRFARPLCIILIACLIFTGIVFAEGDKEEEPSDEEQTDITQIPEGLGPGVYTQDDDTEDEDAEDETVPGNSGSELLSDDRLYLWIGLQYGSGAVDKITLRCADGFRIVKGNNNGWTETDIQTDSTTMTIVPSGGQATLVDQYGTTILGSMAGGAYVVMSAAEDPEDRLITVNGSRYRDGVTATVQGSKLNVINVIELEHYVRGVVANEMGYNYPIEALKAQAITARSYAFRNINKHKSYGFDLCTTQDCQVYRGYVSEHDTTDEACAQTEGKVLVYDGEIVEAYYYAYSGGATMNSEDVWLYALDYCRAREDEYYSDYLWAVHYTMQELTDELVKRGRNIGDVTSVQVTARHPEGTVAEVTFVGTRGVARYSKSTLLSVLGLKSFVFAMGAEQFVWSKDGQAVVTDAEVHIQGAEDARSETETVCVIGADGEVTELEPGELRISNGQAVASPEGTRSAGWTDDPVESSVVYIAGSGWGHGVGMPQTSARNMANEGYTCEDILEYYYEGTEIDDLENFR